MAVHLMRELEKLKLMLFELCETVQEDVSTTVKALLKKDVSLAKKVINNDEKIDAREVEIEEECLKALALFQPVAIDLRFIVAVLKLNSDLERIGDLAVNIAETVLLLSNEKEIEEPFNVENMSERVMRMVSLSLQALVDLNSVLASEVLEMDRAVDAAHRKNYTTIANKIREDVDNIEGYIGFLSISRNLERMADHATNIAEDIIYMVKGNIIRHKT